VGAQEYTLHAPKGDVSIPVEVSTAWAGTHPGITRAAIVFHGKGRNVEGYFEALTTAAIRAGKAAEHALLMAPQFLREEDVRAHQLPERFLRWHSGSWMSGADARGPQPVSAFEVIDAILHDLGDRRLFPDLATIVLIGHSGGAQLLNRYAVAGTEPAALSAAGIHVRMVIANPGTYFYFSNDRPRPDGSLAPFSAFAAGSCPTFNHWKYGPIDPPRYVADRSREAWQRRESQFLDSDVIYLLETADIDPTEQDLDESCAAAAQGSQRLDRGRAYFRYLAGRRGEPGRHRLFLVPGVAHVGSRMIESPCSVAAVFDQGTCAPAASP
jgi:hypothetical protein